MQRAESLPIVLILASGKGLRYRAAGGETHKLKADLCGMTVLQRTTEAVIAAGLHPYVEQGAHAGMADAIAAAVSATRGAAGWLVLPGDMPMVLPRTLRAVAQAIANGAVAAQPVVAGERGHPVGFAATQRDQLLALTGDEGARTVLAGIRKAGLVEEIACEDDRGAVEDIDTPQDLQRAKTLFTHRTPLA